MKVHENLAMFMPIGSLLSTYVLCMVLEFDVIELTEADLPPFNQPLPDLKRYFNIDNLRHKFDAEVHNFLHKGTLNVIMADFLLSRVGLNFIV